MTGPLHDRVRLISDAQHIASDPSTAARFVEGFLGSGGHSLIANANSQIMLVAHRNLRLPITVEDGALGGTYVAAPHSAYVLYARDEIAIMGMRQPARGLGKTALGIVDHWLRAAAINRSVHIDNWMLSTSLHGGWAGEGLPAIRSAVTERFPDHVPIIRCVDPWSCPALFESLQADDWSLLPSRQIWVTDNLEINWKPRSHSKSDRRAFRKSGLTIEEPETITAADAERIVDLYSQLYHGRYSALNPAYSPRFVRHAATSGTLRFRCARNEAGSIMAVAGMRVAGDMVTVPMLGYDTTRPQSDALYRIASLLSSEWAMERGFRHHGSAGAGTFKSNRGARGVIEYMAVYTDHLPRARRLAIKAFAETLERTMVPALKRQGW